MINAERTYQNRLWTYLHLFIHLVFLLFDTVLYETPFSFDLLVFWVVFPDSPGLLFECGCVGFVGRTLPTSASPHLSLALTF